jgi:hypothetical protein
MPYTLTNGQNFPGQQWAFAGTTVRAFLVFERSHAFFVNDSAKPELEARIARHNVIGMSFAPSECAH